MRKAVFFNLLQIQLPVGALTSITHRISGVLLAIGIPFCIDLLGRSLQSPQSYAEVADLFAHWPIKLAALVFVWALAHHVFAGTRHLLGDIDLGSRLPAARRSAWLVNVSGLAVVLFAAGVLF